MTSQPSRPDFSSRHDEVCRLVDNNELRRAGKRLQDLATDYGGPSRQLLNQAKVLSSQVQKLLNDERELGGSEETRSRHSRLVRSILETADLIAENVSSNFETSSQGIQTVAASLSNDEARADHQRTRFEIARDEHAAKRNAVPNVQKSAPKPTFRCEQMSIVFKGTVQFQLKDVSLELWPGEITGVVGVNGSGKSTLLRLVAGELLATHGNQQYPLLEAPRDSPKRPAWSEIKRQISFVHQFPPNWPNILEENLHWQAGLHGLYGKANEDFVDFILVRLGLEKYRQAKWSHISGGYKMRFELAMALVKRPKLLILDEPLAPLDIIAQRDFLQDLRDLANSLQEPLPIFISSQQIFELEAVADRIIVLDAGKVIYSGPVQGVGAGRRENMFEVTGSIQLSELQSLLEDLQIYCSNSGLGGFFLKAPPQITATQILSKLLKGGINISHFRDVSTSVWSLFQRKSET